MNRRVQGPAYENAVGRLRAKQVPGPARQGARRNRPWMQELTSRVQKRATSVDTGNP